MATVKKTTTVTKPKTTTSKIVNNKVTATKPSTTVTKPTTAPKTPTKTGSSIINNKVTATTPKVSNDTYVPMMGSVLNDYYSNQKTNGTVNNNGVTSPTPSTSSGGSSGGKLSSIALQPDGNSYQYNDDGSFNILNSSGGKIGWGAAGTERLGQESLSGLGSSTTAQAQTPTANAEYSKLLEQLTQLQSSFDTRYADLESTWGNKYSTLESNLKTQQDEAQAKYQALMDKYNYQNSLFTNQMGANNPAINGGGAVVDTGTGTGGGQVTNQNTYNDTLYNYLQNIWKGGF